MSTASGAPVLAPRHAHKDDHALVLPPSDMSTDQDGTNKASNAPSAYAAVSRALAGMLAFMFKRPVRLFRPVKSALPYLLPLFQANLSPFSVSTWAGIQAIAEEQGRSVTPGFVRGLLRKEGVRLLLPPLSFLAHSEILQWRFFPKHVLPPLLINATIGLTLFTSYTVRFLPPFRCRWTLNCYMHRRPKLSSRNQQQRRLTSFSLSRSSPARSPGRHSRSSRHP